MDWIGFSGWPTLSLLEGRGFDFSSHSTAYKLIQEKFQNHRPLESHEGSATRKVKTVSKAGPPARREPPSLSGRAILATPAILHAELTHLEDN